MISRSKMSDYAQSIIFPAPNPWYGLNRRSVFNLIKRFRFISDDRGLSKISYPERRFSLGIRSYSWNEYGRALDDLVTREIEPFSWRSNDTYKTISLDTYSDIYYNRKNKIYDSKNARIR